MISAYWRKNPETMIRDRNVYILGAGFSAPAGAPLIHDFIDRARLYFDNPTSKLDERDREHFERFLDFKRRMSQTREKVKIDLDNIEELFGLVEMSHRLGQEPVETRTSTVYVIAKTLELATRSQRTSQINFQARKELLAKHHTPKGFSQAEGFAEGVLEADMYVYFASLASGLLDDPERCPTRTNTFITFDYDLVLESAMYLAGIVPDYHLPVGGTVVGAKEPSLPRCSVLKLHGSTNWGVCPKCGQQFIALFPAGMFGISSELALLQCEKCSQQRLQPLLIPPSWDKSEYTEIMRPVWARAVEELKLASRICVIGYSMPEADVFFRYLLALALAENHNLYKFIVVDTNPKIERKYKKLLEPIFRKRRFFPFFDPVGFPAFLSNGNACEKFGRGELVWGNVNRRFPLRASLSCVIKSMQRPY
jgi:hypothetical protein